MTPEQIAREHFDYLDGLLEYPYNDEDAPDGAWFQRCVDTIALSQSQFPGDPLPQSDPHDIFMSWLRLKND